MKAFSSFKDGFSRLAAFLVAGAWISSAAFAQSSPAITINPSQLGSSFDCSRTGQNIPTLVCNDPDLRLLDLQQMQAYYALRHAAPNQVQEYRTQFLGRVQTLVRECSAKQVVSSGNQRACAMRGLSSMRDHWLAQLQPFNNSAAIEESQLDPQRLISVQTELQRSGLIPGNSAADGVYGNMTRDALARFQRDRGIPASGFANAATVQALLGSSASPPSSQATRMPQQNTAPHQNAGSSSQQSSQLTSPPSPTATGARRSVDLRNAVSDDRGHPYLVLIPVLKEIPYPVIEYERRRVGNIASAAEICTILDHTIFSRGGALASAMGTRGQEINWDINDQTLADFRRFFTNTLQLPDEIITPSGRRRNNIWEIDRNSLSIINNNLNECLRWIHANRREQYNTIVHRFLIPASARGAFAAEQPPCFSSHYVNIYGAPLCADFGSWGGYDRREIFAILLTLREGHPILTNALNRFEASAAPAIARQQAAEQQRRDSETRAREASERSQNQHMNQFRSYRDREKSVLEQVLNFSTTGKTEGSERFFWISGHNGTHKCVLTSVVDDAYLNSLAGMILSMNGAADTRTVDIRSLNQTSFRIRRSVPFGAPSHHWIMITSGDDKAQIKGIFLTGMGGSEPPDLDRLQRAWGLAFQECPGRRSAF